MAPMGAAVGAFGGTATVRDRRVGGRRPVPPRAGRDRGLESPPDDQVWGQNVSSVMFGLT